MKVIAASVSAVLLGSIPGALSAEPSLRGGAAAVATDFEDQAADLIDFVTKGAAKDEEGIYITPDQARKRVAGLPLCDEWDEDYDLDENFKMGKKLCHYTLAVKDGARCKKKVCNAEDEDEEGIYITPDQARKRVANLPLCDDWDEDYDMDENFKMGGIGKKKLCRYTLAVKDGVQCKKMVCNAEDEDEDEEGIYITPDQARKRVANLPLCDDWDEDYDMDENFKMGGIGKKKLCRYTLAVKDGVQCKKMVCNAEDEDEDEEGIYITPDQARKRVANLPLCDDWDEDYDMDENFKMGGIGKKKLCRYTLAVKDGAQCKKMVCN